MRPIQDKTTASLSIKKVLASKAIPVHLPTYASTDLVNIPDSSAQNIGKDKTVQQQKLQTMTCTRNHQHLQNKTNNSVVTPIIADKLAEYL